jgi:SAM-dependent methyltransferase
MGESAHPFKKGKDSDKFFPGAFTWHWHNKWDAPIEIGSKFQLLEKKVNDEYESKFNYEVDKEKLYLGGNIGGGDSGTFYPVMWECLIQDFKIKSVLDVGCGQGHTTRWFLNRGIAAIGLDGLKSNIPFCPNTCFEHDLTIEPYISSDGFDLVWCCEVVEHIEEKYIDNLLKTLVNGSMIAMTYAEPGQPGWHHVNCQPKEYWINKIESIGYQYLPVMTDHLRLLADSWFQKHGLFFVKRVKV